MFTKLTTISNLRKVMDLGIVCLVDTNDKNKMRFAFYTTNFEFIENLEEDYSELEVDEDQENHLIPAFDILGRKIEYLNLSIFTGQAFIVSSIEAPIRPNEDETLLKLDKALVSLEGNEATLINTIDDSQHNLVVQVKENKGIKIEQVNELGKDKLGIKQIFNADQRYKEFEGCLFMSKDNEPVWLSMDKIANVDLKRGKAMLVPTIAYVNSDGNPIHIRLLVADMDKVFPDLNKVEE